MAEPLEEFRISARQNSSTRKSPLAAGRWLSLTKQALEVHSDEHAFHADAGVGDGVRGLQ